MWSTSPAAGSRLYIYLLDAAAELAIAASWAFTPEPATTRAQRDASEAR
jgi:hypothetical protein